LTCHDTLKVLYTTNILIYGINSMTRKFL